MFDIPGKPISKSRPRFARCGKFVKTYNPQESEEGKFICLMQSVIKGHRPIPAGIPIYLKVYFYMPIPASMPKKQRKAGLPHTKKPDLDNLLKFFKDCANGVLWHDDSQVVYISAHKFYSAEPSTQIKMEW